MESNKSTPSGIGIPAEVFCNLDLTQTEKLLFGFIQNLSKSSRGCWASNKYLGMVSGVKEQSISNALSNLQEYQYITIDLKKTEKGISRTIFVNTNYLTIYKPLVNFFYDQLDQLDSDSLLEKLYGSIKKIIDPYKKNYTIKEELKEELKEESFPKGNVGPGGPTVATGKSSGSKIYRDPFLSFTDTAKELFYCWNELPPPIPHHKFKTKSFTRGLEELDRLLNKGYTKEQIKDSMKNYQWLLSMDSSKLKPVYGTVVSLPEFCEFSPFSIKQIEKYNKIIIGIDSWFVECLEPREVLEAKWSKLIKDERPEETKELKRLWKEAGGRRLQGPEDENIFRRISIKAYNYFVELNGKYQWGMVEKYPITRLHYLFDALQAEGQDFSMFRPEWLLSPKMFSDRLPMHWKRIALAKPLTEMEVRELYESPEAKERQRFNSHLYVGESSREATLALIAAQRNKPDQENLEADYD